MKKILVILLLVSGAVSAQVKVTLHSKGGGFIYNADGTSLQLSGNVFSIKAPVSVSNGGTGTTSPGLVSGTGISITGTWPNQTITNTGGGGGGGLTYPYLPLRYINGYGTWQQLRYDSITAGIVAVANGGLGSGTAPANGRLPIGNGSGYTLSTLTQGLFLVITNGAGSITLASDTSATGLSSYYYRKKDTVATCTTCAVTQGQLSRLGTNSLYVRTLGSQVPTIYKRDSVTIAGASVGSADASVTVIALPDSSIDLSVNTSNIAKIVASGDVTAQTAPNSNIATYTVGASNGSFSISAYVNITAIATNIINVRVDYTDVSNAARTYSLNSGTSPVLGSTGDFPLFLAELRCKASTPIKVYTVNQTGGGTETYSAGTTITQIR